eukprot:m.7312 g.7312  ORF g.7312 m.7312 type:complete len:84 (+) comp18331_c0_seq1:20-271(+)
MADPKWQTDLISVLGGAVPLLANTLYGDILDKLLSVGLLTDAVYAKIRRAVKADGEEEAARDLFQSLRRRPSPSFDTFCNVLY